ncbi:hypothetical protein ACFSX9_14515 [Flavobacterium ardleyense]|uniref:CarboxypepD_reg-like domain-containing protein n=1 Tax=Flavobacterium ardleyense TaxID=2038737 RepID=A0ABW5ZAM1_9FLAO
MFKSLLFFFLLLPLILFCQKDTIISGKVVSQSINLEGIHVLNISKKTGEITGDRGYFKIKAQVNDTLQFSAVHLEATRYVIKESDFKTELIFVEMKSLTTHLKEVTLTEYKNINAFSLGIIPASTKSYTPAERRLKSSKSGFIEPVLNLISGRTNTLKNDVGIEKKEFLQIKTSNYFERIYFTQTLHIPEEHVDGFLFYVVENENYARAMKDKNKTMATFLLSGLAVEYLKLKEL